MQVLIALTVTEPIELQWERAQAIELQSESSSWEKVFCFISKMYLNSNHSYAPTRVQAAHDLLPGFIVEASTPPPVLTSLTQCSRKIQILSDCVLILLRTLGGKWALPVLLRKKRRPHKALQQLPSPMTSPVTTIVQWVPSILFCCSEKMPGSSHHMGFALAVSTTWNTLLSVIP